VPETLSIGQVAERTGLTAYALRFYESESLLAAPIGRSRGRRAYTGDDVEWIQLCTVLRASGMPVSVLRSYTELVRHGDANERERLALLRRHREAVLAQVEELSRCLDIVSFKVGVYEDLLETATA